MNDFWKLWKLERKLLIFLDEIFLRQIDVQIQKTVQSVALEVRNEKVQFLGKLCDIKPVKKSRNKHFKKRRQNYVT